MEEIYEQTAELSHVCSVNEGRSTFQRHSSLFVELTLFSLCLSTIFPPLFRCSSANWVQYLSAALRYFI